MAKKRDFYLMEVTRRVQLKVCFEDKLTPEEAVEAYKTNDFYDILDEDVVSEDHDTIAVID